MQTRPRTNKRGRALPGAIAARLPIYYGWVVLAAICCAGFARQGPSVASLSIFVAPMTREFGWSRTAISGAVSLGGVLAALAAPLVGRLLDRRGSRLVLSAAVLTTGGTLLALSLTPSLLAFYLFFCIARMNWAGPFDLGIYGALANWFATRRARAASIATLSQMAGLMAMPLIAQFAISHQGWRFGWAAIGVVTLAVGFVPVWLLLVRRPEDMGLALDRSTSSDARLEPTLAATEPGFSQRQALRTPAFWLLMLFTVMIYPVQAGVSLHQAPHLIQRGLDPTTAALIVSSFSLTSGFATVVCGLLPRRWPARFPLTFAAGLIALGTLLMPGIRSALDGYLAIGLFGAGLGSVFTLLPVAWADYFGRAHYGAIRGVALTMQVLAQASGPLLSGILYDRTGDYSASLHCFAVLSVLGIVSALAARPPHGGASTPASR